MNCTFLHEDNTAVERESFAKKDIDHLPRCSTPIFDRCVGSNRMLYLPEEILANKRAADEQGEYNEWKKSLERKKSSRNFKLRGPGKKCLPRSCGLENSSIISGYFESKLHLISERVTEAIIARPAPVYQMWFPLANHPAYWHQANYANNYPQNQPPMFYGVPAPQQTPQYLQPAQFFHIFNNDHRGCWSDHNLQGGGMTCPHYCAANSQGIQCNVNYALSAPPPQMTPAHFYYQYPHATQFVPCYGETPGTRNFFNVPLQGGNGFPFTTAS